MSSQPAVEGLTYLAAGIAKLKGLTGAVGGAAGLVGKKVKARIERVLDGTAYASLVETKAQVEDPLTAESAAEKPTRKPPAAKKDRAVQPKPEPQVEAPAAEEPEEKPKPTEPQAEQ